MAAAAGQAVPPASSALAGRFCSNSSSSSCCVLFSAVSRPLDCQQRARVCGWVCSDLCPDLCRVAKVKTLGVSKTSDHQILQAGSTNSSSSHKNTPTGVSSRPAWTCPPSTALLPARGCFATAAAPHKAAALPTAGRRSSAASGPELPPHSAPWA